MTLESEEELEIFRFCEQESEFFFFPKKPTTHHTTALNDEV
jgi:hypothetical protein